MSYRTAPAALLSLLALPALALADPGVMMHMNSSVKMQMPGMAMPPQAYSQEICVPEHHGEPLETVFSNSREGAKRP